MAEWFITRKISENIYVTTEPHFFAGNRANIWLVKGPDKDVIIDTGLGVCNLKEYLASRGLVEPEARDLIVVVTHVHFDHSGGAHHFDKVFIHEHDFEGLTRAIQTQTLNYVKPSHFERKPHDTFTSYSYKVPPTHCSKLQHDDVINIGLDHDLQIIHTPGHSAGSICIYYRHARALFSGDFVYDCGEGASLLDWLPTSNCRDYKNSAMRMLQFLDSNEVERVYPGHFSTCSTGRVRKLLEEYVQDRTGCWSVASTGCLQYLTSVFFFCGCFRVCPC